MTSLVAVSVLGYALGSLPIGVWVGRLARGIDVRDRGSGKSGATNVLRTLGPLPAVMVLALDFTKGAVASYYGWHLTGSGVLGAVAGVMSVVGHCWPFMAGFRGGRGVATALGALGGLSFVAFVLVLLTFAAVTATTRYVSLGSIAAALMSAPWCIPTGAYSYVPDAALLLALVAGSLVTIRHADNIDRLRRGREPALRRH